MKENAIYIPNFNICVKDFYIENGKFYYIDFVSKDYKVSLIKFPNDFYSNFIYDTNLKICYMNKNNYIPNLGIYDYQFNFLMGLTAILIAFSFLIGLVIVGATRWFMMF